MPYNINEMEVFYISAVGGGNDDDYSDQIPPEKIEEFVYGAGGPGPGIPLERESDEEENEEPVHFEPLSDNEDPEPMSKSDKKNPIFEPVSDNEEEETPDKKPIFEPVSDDESEHESFLSTVIQVLKIQWEE
jgi:hypothetical protein